jgi:hypothetical protein
MANFLSLPIISKFTPFWIDSVISFLLPITSSLLTQYIFSAQIEIIEFIT